MPEGTLSDRAVYSARPTIRVDGQEHERVTELLLEMELQEQQGGMSSLQLRFSNVASDPSGGADAAFEDDRILRLGATLTVYAGDVAQPREIFRGLVTGIELELSQEAPPELVVLAEDALQRARMARRTRFHEALSVAQLARDVASAADLRAVVTGFDADIGDHMQLNESDLAFLRRLLCAYDGDLQVVGDELHVSPRSEVRRGSLELEMFSQLTRARVCADLADQVTGVSVTGWDAEQAQRISVQSRGAALGPGSGRPGSRFLEQGVGARVEHVGHRPVRTAGEASTLADACFDQRARRFVVLHGSAEGNPSLRVGSHVAIRGMSPRFDNTYYVTGATHRFDQQRGYETDFEAECAFFNGGA